MSKKLRIALIFGGTSEERKVSLVSAKNVASVLSKKYEIIPIEISNDRKWLSKLNNSYKKIDVAFLALHGPGGEDGTVQGVLDLLGLKYTCSGVLASALAMNKALTKRIVASEGVLVAPHVLISKEEYKNDRKKYLSNLKGKLMIKTNHIGSSVGVTISSNKKEIEKGIINALNQDDEVIIEPFLKGREFTVPVLGNKKLQALPVIQIVPKVSDFFDYKAKYKVGGSDEIVPARISKKLAAEMQETALLVHELLNCRGITRSDFIVTEDEKVYFLEINTIPGMTANSLVPKSAAAAGIPFSVLLAKLIQLALNKE